MAKPGKHYYGRSAPPPGSYDPALDAQRRAAKRGLLDLKRDTKRQGRRAQQDFHTQLTNYGRSLSRGREDLATRGTRENRDFGTQLQLLGRKYQLQGQSQQQAANAAGVLDRGTQAASLARRTENQGLETGALTTTHNDFLGDLTRSGTRLQQDYGANVAQARSGYVRGKKDRATRLGRGVREQAINNVDLLQSEIFQARQLNPGAF